MLFSFWAMPVWLGIYYWLIFANAGLGGTYFWNADARNLFTQGCLWATWPLGDRLLEGATPKTFWLLIWLAQSFCWGLFAELVCWAAGKWHPIGRFFTNLRDTWRAIQASRQESVCLAGLAGYVGLFLATQLIANPTEELFRPKGLAKRILFWSLPWVAAWTVLWYSRLKLELARIPRLTYLLCISGSLLLGTLILFPIAVGMFAFMTMHVGSTNWK